MTADAAREPRGTLVSMAAQTGQGWKRVAIQIGIGAGAVAGVGLVAFGVYKASQRLQADRVEPWMLDWSADLKGAIEAAKAGSRTA